MAETLSRPERRVPPTTVQYWKDTGFIPQHLHPEILEIGQQLDPPLTKEDFWPDPAHAGRKPGRAA